MLAGERWFMIEKTSRGGGNKLRRRAMRLRSLLLGAAVLVTGCAADSVVSEVGSGEQGGKAMAFELKSAAFTAGSNIPKEFTCDGPDVSALCRGLPVNTRRSPVGRRCSSESSYQPAL